MHVKRKDNIIFFPKVIERHIEEAWIAKEKGDKETAMLHAEQAYHLGSDMTDAIFTLAVMSYDYGCFDKTISLCEDLLEHDLWDHGEVLKLYIGSLFQVDDFAKANEVIETILTENHISPEFKHDLLQLLDLSVNELDYAGFYQEKIREKLRSDQNYKKKLYSFLCSGTVDEQLQAVEQLAFDDSIETISILKEFLVAKEKDPIVKTFVLKALKSMGCEGIVTVYKSGTLYETKIRDVPMNAEEIREEEKKVMEILTSHIYNEEPSFLKFAFQLWMEYLFTLFPVRPKIISPKSWAAGVHYCAAKMLHQQVTLKKVSEIYGVSAATVSRKCKRIASYLNGK